jgi:hypothetical protein
MLKNLFDKAFAATQGRHTFFVISFFLSGNILHWFHRLDGVYIGYMATLMSFLLGRTISGDITAMAPAIPPLPALPAAAPVVQIQTGSPASMPPPPPMVPPPAQAEYKA